MGKTTSRFGNVESVALLVVRPSSACRVLLPAGGAKDAAAE
ncbi:hypothetical protein AB395_00004079 [Sinorhizobium fredii CCBAU 45436]|nr:hypothetical protein AB395_00004079 [Sinorhizobium fredii CCBAU 45436]